VLDNNGTWKKDIKTGEWLFIRPPQPTPQEVGASVGVDFMSIRSPDRANVHDRMSVLVLLVDRMFFLLFVPAFRRFPKRPAFLDFLTKNFYPFYIFLLATKRFFFFLLFPSMLQAQFKFHKGRKLQLYD
jgi:hypothetical protein